MGKLLMKRLLLHCTENRLGLSPRIAFLLPHSVSVDFPFDDIFPARSFPVDFLFFFAFCPMIDRYSLRCDFSYVRLSLPATCLESEARSITSGCFDGKSPVCRAEKQYFLTSAFRRLHLVVAEAS